MILDTGGLLVLAHGGHPFHEAAKDALQRSSKPLRLPPTVIVEFQFVCRRDGYARAFPLLLANVGDGTFELSPLGTEDVSRAGEIINRYPSLDLDFTDATVAAIAERENDLEVLTTDVRDFQVLRTRAGHRFKVVPAGQPSSPEKPKRRRR